ncbi:tetratricopeptide repeat protein [Nonomuraea rhodomycinica]|uniref:Tetratricopeptide repeat protein n=1 Tax=Nonomuraea rhodomycinica TaxID=1712872 RepID=A0A7Y6IUY9_9ACTN|nr:tetratricopeptide repeat protein [Nonomuraea rhodomycinica]NUW44872.1 tetratricopeptide repeat protein [Nonomuraea rhodomycinica]
MTDRFSGGTVGLGDSRAEKAAERGEEHRLAGRYEAAVEEFTRAIDLVPDHAYALGSRGQALSAMGHVEAALADFDRAVELDPDLGWVYVERGRALADADRDQEALADYDRVIALFPEDADAHTARGDLLWDDPEAAVAAYSRAIELDPGDSFAPLIGRAALHRLDGRLEEALADYDRAVELDADVSYVFRERGRVNLRLKRYEEALADLNRAIDLDPDDSDSYTERARVQYELERLDEALADVNVALAAAPDDSESLELRGILHMVAGRPATAVADLDRAIELDPRALMAVMMRGQVHEQLRLYDAAYADFSRAIELGLDDADTYVSRGNAALLCHRAEDARADAGLALERDPDHFDALLLRGLANWTLGRLFEAHIDLMRADRLSPGSPVVARCIEELGPVLEGQMEEALMMSFAELVADSARELVAAESAVEETRTTEAAEFAVLVSVLRDEDEAGMEDTAAVEARLARDPGDPFALAVRAVLHRSAGRHAAALADLDAILRADPAAWWAAALRHTVDSGDGVRQEADGDLVWAYRLGGLGLPPDAEVICAMAVTGGAELVRTVLPIASRTLLDILEDPKTDPQEP